MRRVAFALFVSIAAGCAHYEAIPYELDRVKTAKKPAHGLTLAILPLRDARLKNELPDKKGRFIYRKVEYKGTQLEKLPGNAMWRLTEVLGQHLARTNHFEKVMLVLSRGQASDADLFLDGKVLRARGYVEANPPDEKSGRPPEERKVLSEVAFTELRVTDRDGRVLMDVEVGWSTFGVERQREDQEPLDPWKILAKTMRVALTKLSDEMAGADLSGGYVVAEKVGATTTGTVGFAALGDVTPDGWRFTETSTGSAPVGWTGEARCRAARFEQRQTIRFHRFLGPYRPGVDLWSCPKDVAFSYDARADFPAQYVGERSERRYFLHTVGKTNWPKAIEELTKVLGVTPPENRHTFELPAR